MGRGYVWLDTETYESLLEATQYWKKAGIKGCACIEEIAYEKGYIDKNRLIELA